MRAIIFILRIAFCLVDDSLLVVYDSKTSKDLISAFLDSNLQDYSSIDENLFQFSEFPSLILDLSFSSSGFSKVEALAEFLKVPYLTLARSHEFGNNSYRFHVLPSAIFEAKALLMMIEFLEWKKFTIFSSNTYENIQILNYIKNQSNDLNITTIIYSTESSYSEIDSLVKRFLKVTGSRHLLVLDQGTSLDILMSILIKRKINQYGTYIMFNCLSISSVNLEGALIISLESVKDSTSTNDFYIKLIKNFLNLQKSFSLEKFQNSCRNSYCNQNFTIINFINNERIIVGSIEDSVIIDKKIIFPGLNNLYSSKPLIVKLPIMIVNETMKPQSIGDKVTSTYYYGAQLAAELENRKMRTQGFEYELIPVDCGNLVIDLQTSLYCLSKYLNVSALASLAAFWTSPSIMNLFSLRILQKSLPQVSPFGISDYLNSESDYPEFLKLSGKFSDYLENSVFLIRYYDWKSLVVLMSDDELNTLLFPQIEENMKKLGVKLLNPPEFRYLPKNYTRNDFENFKHIFKYVKDSLCRIILILFEDPGYFLEGLYDIGLRKGEVLIISNINSYFTLMGDEEERFMSKRKEIFSGALIGNPTEFEGEFGSLIEQQLKNKYSPVINMCLTFDGFLAISNSINYLLSKGEDYEDKELLGC